MSDSVEDLSKRYRDDVYEERARSVGLFPIPEYPEYESKRGMLSTVLDVLLTTLRYLAPATILTLFWGQQSFLFKILKYIDSAFRGVLFSSEERKQAVLQWLTDTGPARVDELDVVWRHGWIICGVLDSALPGACAGHPPTRLSLKHAQTIADNYLGVEPVFSRYELESIDSINKHQEWRLVNYLDNIRIAVSKVTPPTSKGNNQSIHRQTSETEHFTLNYIVRGSGLVAAQVNTKVYFKVYPTAQQSLDPGDINILIHGPKETYGMTVLPPVLGKAQLIRQNLLGLQSKSTYTDNVLPITHGTSYLRNYGRSNINKTYYIPKTKYDIDIETEILPDHARVSYVATSEGKYEISIMSKGQNVVGSPFKVTASKDIVGVLERDSFCLEDGEEIDIVDIKTDKKVVLRIVDFVTEKMLLKESGSLEKITEEEAKYLMENDVVNNKNNKRSIKIKTNSGKFFEIAQKILTLNSICNFLSDFHKKKLLNQRNISMVQQHIPDIVNSTFNDEKELNKSSIHCSISDRRDRFIVPENISVSILTEKPAMDDIKLRKISTPDIKVEQFLDDSYNTVIGDPFDDDNVSVGTVQSSANPFLCDMNDQIYSLAKQFGSFIPNEYESNNSQNEETENANTKSIDKAQYESVIEPTNPFQDYFDVERPKTPVYKIITGEVTGRNDSVYINPETEISLDKNICTDFINPFIDHDQHHMYQEKPDFIIGAPVSLPPLVNVPSSTPSSVTLTKASSIQNTVNTKDIKYKQEIVNKERKMSNSSNNSNLYSSFDSNMTEDVNITPNSGSLLSSAKHLVPSRETSPRKDTWDSAYVSIDDNNCSSDSNISELSNETFNKRKFQVSTALSKMGPAEKELWQNDQDWKITKHFDDDLKTHKHEIKRHEFTPILEENEKLMKDVSGMKDENNEKLIDSVTEAFVELDNIYDDIMEKSEVSSVTSARETESRNLEVDYTLDKTTVDSASGYKADVKRQTKILEGKISEIQARVTESISASRCLHVKETHNTEKVNEKKFGDETYTNIVLEKKKYWDEKIRQIEAKSEELKSLQNKRRVTLKHMRRNDSLSKRRGKKVVKNFLSTGLNDSDVPTKPNTRRSDTYESLDDIEIIECETIGKSDRDLSNQEETSCFGSSSNNKEHSFIDILKNIKVSNNINISTESDGLQSNPNLKQELSEKVFQAFETSPKRFFGTSRKQILNKIDTFLGLPDSENDKKKVIKDVNHESGLVSSRISLFHNISQTEEPPWARRKSKSMYNINHYNGNKNECSDSNIRVKRSFVDTEKEDELKSSQNATNSFKEKQTRLKLQHKSFDECLYNSRRNKQHTKDTISDVTTNTYLQNNSKTTNLKSISKSEMDIFNKVETSMENTDLEKHKSYEELPKVNVKSFISLYEDVSKSSKPSLTRSVSRSNCIRSSNLQISSSISGTPQKLSASVNEIATHITLPSKINTDEPLARDMRRKILAKEKNFEVFSNESASSSFDFEVISNQDQESNRLSFSDIEIEIIEKDLEKPVEQVEEKEAHLEYKNRFTMAKKYFQSLEELRDVKKTLKLTETDLFSSSQSTESLEEPKPRRRSTIKKSLSMPSSEIAKIWHQMQEEKESESKKLVKISEKFNVDDLFEDVMEGRLSRQGSLRGIPHKKAVLEAFRSMENVADTNLNSYEMAVSQLNDFASDNKIKNAQTYLSEYPYLPTTDPSKYHSRLDANASGLITLKELKKIPRRNSVPDLRLNATFTADL